MKGHFVKFIKQSQPFTNLMLTEIALSAPACKGKLLILWPDPAMRELSFSFQIKGKVS
jgi:hypothetical protein